MPGSFEHLQLQQLITTTTKPVTQAKWHFKHLRLRTFSVVGVLDVLVADPQNSGQYPNWGYLHKKRVQYVCTGKDSPFERNESCVDHKPPPVACNGNNIFAAACIDAGQCADFSPVCKYVAWAPAAMVRRWSCRRYHAMEMLTNSQMYKHTFMKTNQPTNKQKRRIAIHPGGSNMSIDSFEITPIQVAHSAIVSIVCCHVNLRAKANI